MSTQQDYVGCVNGENRVKGYIEVEGGETAGGTRRVKQHLWRQVNSRQVRS